MRATGLATRLCTPRAKRFTRPPMNWNSQVAYLPNIIQKANGNPSESFSCPSADLSSRLRVQELMIEKQDLKLRILSVIFSGSLLTFGMLVETYKLLF